jgi:hypothetical protein
VIRAKEDVRNQDFLKDSSRQKHFSHFGSIKIDVINEHVLTSLDQNWSAVHRLEQRVIAELHRDMSSAPFHFVLRLSFQFFNIVYMVFVY